MFFLIKCVFWLAVLFMILPSAAPPAPTAVVLAVPKTRDIKTHTRAAPSGSDLLSSLSEAANDKLIGAAREHCLSHPRECPSLLGVDLSAEKSKR